MKFRVIYGKAGSGKSTYLFNYIKDIIDGPRKIYIITPEQFSFTAERKLLDVTKGVCINAEVLTFSRMAYRVIKEIGNQTQNIEPFGKSMLIYDILDDKKKELMFLGKNMQNVETISKTLTEFKKHNITEEKLENAIKSIDDKYLKAKLQDVSTIYTEYEQKIKEKFIDENDTLTILADNLKNTDMFKDSVILIDEFAGFTPQEYRIIEELMKITTEINVTMCIDEISDYCNESDIFYSNKQAINKLMSIAQANNIEIEKAVFLNKNYRFKNQELIHLEENIYANVYKKYKEENEKIKLFLAMNPYSEVEHTAEKIVEEVRENGYRYKDIGIITKNIETYSSLIKAIFSKYDIPVYIDEKKDLSQNILIKHIICLLDVFAKNWSYDSVISYIKTGFCNIKEDDIYEIENYAKKWDIKYSKWYKEDWNFGEEDKHKIDKLNITRRNAIEPLLKFKEKCFKHTDAKNITKAIYEFLIENEIDRKLMEKANLQKEKNPELADEYETSFNTVIKILDEIVKVFGEEKIGYEKYASFLKISFSENGLGKIPAGIDQVTVGDVDRSRSHNVKIIFILGLNDGVFPNVNNNEGFLNDSDRENLKKINVELAKTTLEALYNDNFNIYKAFTTSEEKLYLSYISADNDGTAQKPSTLLIKIKKIFPKLQETSDITQKEMTITNKKATFEELLLNIRNYKDGKEIDEIWFEIYNIFEKDEDWKEKLENAIKAIDFSNMPEKISAENIQKLYGKTLKTSVSRLEQYRKCPFSFYLKYGLKIEEKDTFKLESLDTGSFMHDVIDTFFERVQDLGLSVREMEDDNIKQIIDEIVEEKLNLPKNYIFISSAKFKNQTIKLKRLVLKAMKYIIETIKNSDFEVLEHEVEFGEGKKYSPIQIDLDDGKKVEIIGKIDRVDIAKDERGKYLRIIDYKSSIKDIDLNDVAYGLQIQLLTYLDAITKNESAESAGILYFNMVEPIIKADKKKTEEELEDEIRKRFKMKGLILADVKVIKMMDKNLESGYSDVVPVYLGKEGISEKKSSIATKEQFNALQKYIIKVIKDISKDILSGKIDIKPYYKNKKTSCEYCEYKGICQFDKNKNEYSYVSNLKDDEIWKNINS